MRKGVKMFFKLNDRVYLNANKITRLKVDEVQDGIRIRFYEGSSQVAKSQKFSTIEEATKWINDNMK